MAENSAQAARLFIAVELPEETKRELSHVQEGLKRACGYCPARWVAPDSIHLTLSFLGDVPILKIDGIKDALTQVGADFKTFDLSLDGVGAFPNLERPHVVWVGLGGDTGKLSSMQKKLEGLLALLGFNLENRPFSPHLTLARVRDEASPADKKRLGQAIGSTTCRDDCLFSVHEISLIKSYLTPAGPVYTVLFSAPLGSENH